MYKTFLVSFLFILSAGLEIYLANRNCTKYVNTLKQPFSKMIVGVSRGVQGETGQVSNFLMFLSKFPVPLFAGRWNKDVFGKNTIISKIGCSKAKIFWKQSIHNSRRHPFVKIVKMSTRLLVSSWSIFGYSLVMKKTDFKFTNEQ